MSRTVTALYDNRSDAEAAKQRLSSTVDTECVKIVDQSSSQSSDSQNLGSGDGQKEHGSWLSRLFIDDQDRHAYSEGVRRGGYLLCAEVDSDEDADRIVSLLEQTSGTVNLDERQESWRSEGWTPYSGETGFGAGSGSGTSQSQMSQSQMSQGR
jgi:hypothetical protein